MKSGKLLVAAVLGAVLGGGCTGTLERPHQNEPRPAARVPVIDEGLAQPAGASALVFDPPITRGMPELDLSRAGREPEAFWGYDSGTTTAYYLRTDDRQFDDSWNGVNRRAISERFGVSSR